MECLRSATEFRPTAHCAQSASPPHPWPVISPLTWRRRPPPPPTRRPLDCECRVEGLYFDHLINRNPRCRTAQQQVTSRFDGPDVALTWQFVTSSTFDERKLLTSRVTGIGTVRAGPRKKVLMGAKYLGAAVV